jgi:nicotinamidase/pyrazinamidase
MPDVVIVVDMQRGFLEKGFPLYCGEGARGIIPSVRRLIERETARDSNIIFTQDSHAPDDKEFRMFPPHCIKGTAEAEIIPELAGYAGEILEKSRYSAFYNTDLDERLAKAKPNRLLVCGVCTDICVMHTVADARNRDYAVEVYTECVASFDQEAHDFALKHIEKILGARLTSL